MNADGNVIASSRVINFTTTETSTYPMEINVKT